MAGGLLGLSAAPLFMHTAFPPAPRTRTAWTPPISGPGFSYTYSPPPVRPRASAKTTVTPPGSSGFQWSWMPPASKPSSGAPSWRQYANAPPPKPPPAGQRRGPTPPPSPSSVGGRVKIHIPSREEILVTEIAQKMDLPKKPTSKAEINKILKTKAKELHSDVGGDSEKLKDITRWHSYWIPKLSHLVPDFQNGFIEELSKIASF